MFKRCFCSLMIIALLSFSQVLPASSESIRTTKSILFQWTPVTTNSDGITPCDDLGGYALFRSRTSGIWGDLNTKEKAFCVFTHQQIIGRCECIESGIWFWTIRAFDTLNQFSEPSNEVESFVDVLTPGIVIEIQICLPGDLDCDGDVDIDDLSNITVNFGTK